MEYGRRLNPEHSLRTPKGIKGTRQKVTVTHNPSEIDQNQDLLVRFPNLGSDDVIIPGMVNLSFNIELISTIDTNRKLVSNIGRVIVKKLAVKFEGNEITSIDDYDLFACYQDLWKTKSEKRNAIQQGIISADGCTENCIKLRINAGDKSTGNARDKATADAYRNKFIIPLDFEMLVQHSITKQASRTDYVMSLRSMITTELPNPEYHHQKFQMPRIRSHTYP